MDKRKRNITALGLLVVIATVVFFWGLYYLLGNPLLTGGLDLTIAMQNGAGLKRGDRVFVNGVDVGLVQNVDLDPSGGVVVGIRVRDDLALPRDTKAAVMGDVFGAHSVQLQPGIAVLRLEDKDTLRGAASPQITELAADLGARTKAVLGTVDSLLSSEAVRNVQATAAELPASAVQLRETFVQLRQAAVSLRRTADEFAEAHTGDAVNRALGQLDAATGEFEKTAQALTSAANSMERSLDSFQSVMAKIDHGQGTMGRLVNDSTMYMELHQTLHEFRLLATDIRERPSRYINVRIF